MPPADSMELEIKPYALAEIEKVRAAFEGRQFGSLLELLGTSEAQAVIGVDDDQSKARSFAPLRMTDWKYSGIEHTLVEAVLKADPTGYMLKHPWIHSQVDRLLAKWAYKVSTAGALRLPAFALADDGYLVERASVARTFSVGPRLFVVNWGRTADLQNRSALHRFPPFQKVYAPVIELPTARSTIAAMRIARPA